MSEPPRRVLSLDERLVLLHPEVVVVDLETTGLSASMGGIVEIGAVLVADGGVTGERFQTLVHPGQRIPWEATRVHGITDAMVASAPPEREAIAAFLDWAAGRPLVAHNAPFDLSFLQTAAARAGLPLPRQAICTVRLSRRLLPGGRHNLDAVCERLGVTAFDRHRAMGDTLATAEVFVRLRQVLRGQAESPEPARNPFADWMA